MRIAYFLDNYPAPTETFIAREIAALRRRGCEITIFALHAGEGAQPLSVPARWRRWLPGSSASKYFKLAGAQWWHQNQMAFDHIHAGWASYPALVAWGAAEVSGLPWSFSGHARDLFVDGNQWADKLDSARFAAVCTRAGQKFLQKAAPAHASRVLYIPHGLDLAEFPYREPAPPPEKTLRILGVGRLVEKKGFDLLLHALHALREWEYSCHLTIIGDGPLLEPLKKLRDQLGLREDLHFAGRQPADRVLEAMRAADVFALPCRVARDGDRDGLPNVLLEAAAVGLPIVTTHEGGIQDFLDESTGWFCETDADLDLAKILAAVWREPHVTIARCQAARARVERDFDIEKNIEVLVRAFRP